ncbi:hypothetical protein JCM10207_001186 [Rhodosporidiobolus poonsookiae]
MLFSRALPILGLFGVAFASISHEPIRHDKRLTVSADVQAQVEVALNTAISTIDDLGCELKTALEGVEDLNATEIVSAVSGIVQDITVAVGVCASAIVKATLVASLLNTTLGALAPLEEVIESVPLVGTLLAPVLAGLNVALVGLLNLVLALVAGLLNTVLGLLDATVAPVIRGLGLGGLLSILNL